MDIMRHQYKRIILILLIGYLLFSIFPGIQFGPIGTGLDNSSVYATNHLAHSEYIFGRDVVFTLGPLGYLLQPLDIGHNLIIAIIFWMGLYILFAATLLYLLFQLKKLLPFFLFILAFLLSWAFMNASFAGLYFAYQYLFLLLVGLLLCASSLASEKISYTFVFMAGLLAGLSLFMKLNLGIAAFSMILIYSLILIIRKKGYNWHPVIAGWTGYLLSVVFILIVHFKSFGNLGQWIRGSLDLISGYSAAMSYGTLRIPISVLGLTMQIPLLIFGLLGLCLYTGLTIFCLKQRSSLIFISLIFLLPVFFTFKEGFVRQDPVHFIYFFLFLPLVISTCLLFASNKKELIWCSGFLLAILIPIIVFPVAARSFPSVTNDFSRASAIITGQTGRSNISALIQLEKTRDQIADQSRQNLEKDRLPAEWVSTVGNSTVDVVPWEICYIPANGFKWKPNPVLQTYSEYTSFLDNWSASHYAGDQSPQFLIAGFMDIDGRHPFMDASATWRSILLNYQLAGYDRQANRLLLERKPVDTNEDFKIINDTKAAIGQWIEVPSDDNLLYAKIGMRPNLAGKITGALYLIPPVNIDLIYDSGQAASYRIIPETLADGILLNFPPSSGEELSELLTGSANERVERFRIFGPGVRYYSNDIDITWLEMPHPVKYAPDEQLSPEKLVLVGKDTLYSVDNINNLPAAQNNYTVVVDTKKDTTITIKGWAVDQKTGTAAGGAFINIDSEKDIPALYGSDRSDVADDFKNSNYRFSGFSASFATSILDKGQHILSLKIVTADRKGYYQPDLKIIVEIK